MDIQKIREGVKNLPHIKTVWIKGSEYFIHKVAGAKEVSLTVIEAEKITETNLQDEKPVSKRKK